MVAVNVRPGMSDVAATVIEEALGLSTAALLLPKPSAWSSGISTFSGICTNFGRVTDGVRTRHLRSHNPPKGLQIPHI